MSCSLLRLKRSAENLPRSPNAASGGANLDVSETFGKHGREGPGVRRRQPKTEKVPFSLWLRVVLVWCPGM